MWTRTRLALLSFGVVMIGACSRPVAPPPAAAPAAATAEPLATSLKVVCWDDYITPAVAADFEREFGVKLEVEFLNNNEEGIARLEAGEVWDLWAPSDYAVQIAKEKGLLAPLDHQTVANLGQIGRRFRNLIYDREYQFAVPYYWGTSGLGYDKKVFQRAPDSWSYVFDDARRRDLKGRISLLDDARETLSIALIYLGYDPNTSQVSEIAAARDLLIKAKPFVRFDSETYDDNFTGHKVALAHGWSGDLDQAVAADPQLGFALPREGFMVWIDNWAIPKASTKHHTAQVLINYLLQPAVAAKLVNENRNGITVAEARPLIAPDIVAGLAFSLPEDRPFFVFKYPGAEATAEYEKAWAAVRE